MNNQINGGRKENKVKRQEVKKGSIKGEGKKDQPFLLTSSKVAFSSSFPLHESDSSSCNFMVLFSSSSSNCQPFFRWREGIKLS